MIRDSNLNWRINPDPDLSQNVVDSLPSRCLSFCQVLYKSSSDCMRNANKSLKTPYFTLVRKMKIDPESVSWTGAPSKVNQFFQLVDPIIKPTFNEIDSLLFQ